MRSREISEKGALSFYHWRTGLFGKRDKRIKSLFGESNVFDLNNEAVRFGNLSCDALNVFRNLLKRWCARDIARRLRFLSGLQHRLHWDAKIGWPFRCSLRHSTGADDCLV